MMARVTVDRVTLDTSTSRFVVILKEEEENRWLPIVVGSTEAQAIALQLENISKSRLGSDRPVRRHAPLSADADQDGGLWSGGGSSGASPAPCRPIQIWCIRSTIKNHPRSFSGALDEKAPFALQSIRSGFKTSDRIEDQGAA